jgi:hypothetical protein
VELAMPNLGMPDVRNWFSAVHRPLAPSDWPPTIRAIEERDGHPRLLGELGAMLDEATSRDPEYVSAVLLEDTGPERLRGIVSQLGMARLLRVLHWALETDLPNVHDLVPHLLTGEDLDVRALRSALAALNCRITLGRMFSPSRIAALDAACAVAEKEAV